MSDSTPTCQAKAHNTVGQSRVKHDETGNTNQSCQKPKHKLQSAKSLFRRETGHYAVSELSSWPKQRTELLTSNVTKTHR